MIDPAINSAAGAFVAGLVTSVHCAGMCGPVACLAGVGDSSARSTALYHGGRIVSYASVGALAGTIGKAPLELFANSPAIILPWFLVIVLAAVGLGIDRVVPKPRVLSRWYFRSKLKIGSLSPSIRGATLGLITPLFPCAPLYVMFGIALVSGSAVAGAEFTAAFALGTIPLLWLAQQPLRWLGGRLAPGRLVLFQRSIALVTAAILAFRLRGTLWFYENTDATALACPLCNG